MDDLQVQPETTIGTDVPEGNRETEVGPLPGEWGVEKLGQVVLKTAQADPKKRPDQLFKYVDVSAVSNDALAVTGYTEHKGGTAPSRARKLIQSEDVIFATVRPYLRRVAKIPPELNGHVCSTAFCVIRANPDLVDSDFLFFSVSADSFVDRVSEYQRGSGYPAVSDKDVLRQPVPLPSLPEQKAIAHVLRTVRKAIETTEQVIESTRELKRSLMNHLFTYGPVPVDEAEQVPLKETEVGPVPEHWDILPIGDVATVRRGASPRPKGDPKYFSQSGSVHWIRISDLRKYKRGKYLEGTDEFLTEEGKEKSYFVPYGTLLLTNSGTVGIPTILHIEGCIHDGYLALLEPQTDDQFIYYFLEYSRKRLEQLAPRGTQANLNTIIVKKFPLPVPATSEQREITHNLSVVDQDCCRDESSKNPQSSLQDPPSQPHDREGQG